MTWSVFYIDQSGEGFSETCADWSAARDTCHGFIDMVNPKNTDVTFHRELNMVEPEHSFHFTDGVFSFAIETI
jgi:hypothetical protein